MANNSSTEHSIPEPQTSPSSTLSSSTATVEHRTATNVTTQPMSTTLTATTNTVSSVVSSGVTCPMLCFVIVPVIGGLVLFTLILCVCLLVCKKSRTCCCFSRKSDSNPPVLPALEDCYQTSPSAHSKSQHSKSESAAGEVRSFTPVGLKVKANGCDSTNIYANRSECVIEEDSDYINVAELHPETNYQRKHVPPIEARVNRGGMRPTTILPPIAAADRKYSARSNRSHEYSVYSEDSFDDDVYQNNDDFTRT